MNADSMSRWASRRPDETLAELEQAGYGAEDRLQLRFSFEASALRAAVDLADDLRLGSHSRVQIRPMPRRLLTSHRWAVFVTTPSAPLLYAVIRLWEEQMQDVVSAHPACRILGWRPIVTRVRADTP